MKAPTRFEKIVFMDDFFRSSDNELCSNPTNRQFLRRTFSLPAARLGLRCEEHFAASEHGNLNVGAMMDSLGLQRGAAGWAKATLAGLQPMAGLLPRFDPGALIVGWGLPPSLMHWIDASGASFIDFEISPVRFGSHLLFCARTNDRSIEAVLEGMRVDDESFWNEATILMGVFARRGSPVVFHPKLSVGLFCGQTAIDLALVQNGEIALPMDHLDEIQALAKEVDLLVFKPHPFEPNLRHLKQVADRLPNAVWSNANIYALLCADNLEFIAGLSTGALQEAAFFMKPSVALIAPDRNNRALLPASCSSWIPVGPDIMSLGGLATLCARPEVAMTHASHMPDDALDRAFLIRWGFDAQAPGLPQLPEWGMDSARPPTFGTDMDTNSWLSYGWSAPEPGGVWTEGEQANLVVPVHPCRIDAAATLEVVIEGEVFAGLPPANPVVRAFINGVPACQEPPAPEANPATLRLRTSLPWDAFEGGQILAISIDIANPQRPCDCGMNGDQRRLGFFLKQISISPPAEIAEPEGAEVEIVAVETIEAAVVATVASAKVIPLPVGHHRLAMAAVTVVLVCAAAGAIGLRHGSAAPTAQTASASNWSVLKQSVVSHVNSLRGDVRVLMQRHEI